MSYILVTSYRDGKEVGKQLFDGNNQAESLEKYKILHPEQADCILVAEDYKDGAKGDDEEYVPGSASEKYDFVKAIEEVIAECVRTGAYSQVQRIDENGHITVWLEADWRYIGNDTKVVELFFCYTDTGKVAYSTFISETERRLA